MCSIILITAQKIIFLLSLYYQGVVMKLYTSNQCPKCQVAKLKLQAAGISYEECTNYDEPFSIGIRSLPCLKLDDNTFLEFSGIINMVSKA